MRHVPAHGVPVDGDPCGKSVDDATDGSAMGFPKNGDFQFLSECIAHRICPLMGSRFRVQGSGFRVQGSGFRVQGSGFREMVRRIKIGKRRRI